MTARHGVIGAIVGAAILHGGHTLSDYDRAAYQRLVGTIEQEEGFRGTPYTDTQGRPTIGDGTLLPLTPAEGSLLLESRLRGTEARFRRDWPFFDNVPIEAQAALLDLAYQVGVRGALGFKKMLAALERFDYPAAAAEVIDSRLDHQTPKRAERVAAAFRNLAN